MPLDIQQIDKRLSAIGEEVARLQKEAEELTIAKRVFERFSGKPPNGSALPKTEDTGKPRPKGTPTNFEMAEFVLADAEKEGKDGLDANDLVQAIAARYWPGLVGPQILPSVYGFGKTGRLRFSGGKFRRVHKKTADEAG